MASAALQEAQKALDAFKAAYAKGDAAGARGLLPALKLKLTALPALPPGLAATPTAQQELALARDALEHAAMLSLKLQDEALQERNFAQLRAFYADTAGRLPPSPQEAPLAGLHLLRLLVQNRIAEFHTELELIGPAAQAAPFVAHAIQLERWLMEGAYNKVLSARKSPPSELHAPLMEKLAAMVRDEIASCSEKAYESLGLGDAAKALMLDSEAAAREFAGARGWAVAGGRIVFASPADAPASARQALSMDIIKNTLVYAKELERIV